MADDKIARWNQNRLAMKGRPHDVGDVFVLPLSEAPFFALLKRHPEDKGLFYGVPADTAPWVGALDIRVDEEQGLGPVVMRCGFGRWVSKIDVQRMEPAGTLSSELVDGALARIGRWLRETTGLAETGSYDDNDPGYLEWLRDMSVALDAWLQMETQAAPLSANAGERSALAKVYSLSDFIEQAPQETEHNSKDAQVLVAAGGLVGDIWGILSRYQTFPVRVLTLDYDEGEILLVSEEDGLQLLYHSALGSDPPVVRYMFPGEDDLELMSWELEGTEGRWTAMEIIPWYDDTILLRVGVFGEAHYKITR